MSVSAKRTAEDPIDEAGRRAAGRPVNAEEMLAELVRLVESSGLAKPGRMDAVPPPAEVPRTRTVGAGPRPRPAEAVEAQLIGPDGIPIGRGPRSRAWIVKVSALALAGVAMIGSVLWLKLEGFGLPKTPPVVATSPAASEPLSDSKPASPAPAVGRPAVPPAEAGGAHPDSVARPAGKAPPAPERPTEASAPTLAAQRAAEAPAERSPAAEASPPAAAQPADAPPVAAASLSAEPAETSSPAPAARLSGETVPLPPVRPASKASSEAAAPLPPVRPAPPKAIETRRAAPPASRPEPPGKLASQSPAHGAAPRTDAIAPGEAQAVPPESSPPVNRRDSNPVVHTFNSVVGTVTGFLPFH